MKHEVEANATDLFATFVEDKEPSEIARLTNLAIDWTPKLSNVQTGEIVRTAWRGTDDASGVLCFCNSYIGCLSSNKHRSPDPGFCDRRSAALNVLIGQLTDKVKNDWFKTMPEELFALIHRIIRAGQVVHRGSTSELLRAFGEMFPHGVVKECMKKGELPKLPSPEAVKAVLEGMAKREGIEQVMTTYWQSQNSESQDLGTTDRLKHNQLLGLKEAQKVLVNIDSLPPDQRDDGHKHNIEIAFLSLVFHLKGFEPAKAWCRANLSEHSLPLFED